jgi:hypothetical protein
MVAVPGGRRKREHRRCAIDASGHGEGVSETDDRTGGGPRPVVLAVSRCLLGERVRYDGGDKALPWLRSVPSTLLRVIPICPEGGRRPRRAPGAHRTAHGRGRPGLGGLRRHGARRDGRTRGDPALIPCAFRTVPARRVRSQAPLTKLCARLRADRRTGGTRRFFRCLGGDSSPGLPADRRNGPRRSGCAPTVFRGSSPRPKGVGRGDGLRRGARALACDGCSDRHISIGGETRSAGVNPPSLARSADAAAPKSGRRTRRNPRAVGPGTC